MNRDKKPNVYLIGFAWILVVFLNGIDCIVCEFTCIFIYIQ